MKSGKDFIGIGCGAIIINDKNEVLLVKRSKTSRVNPDIWSRPGGEVEFGESSAKAVEREVLEETGIIIKAVRPLGFLDNISPD
ncbi:MAG: NUDIX domain-containing protein, partial [Candidatus Aenigmarchaeota archaeon]|nr:NUDIX domain-containing protein [Candidatus Aenigmarchaeota archaeon]